jgi:hypothetical protein
MNQEQGTATIEFVLKVCNDIFSEIKTAYKNTTEVNEKFCDDLHSDLIKNYKDFSSMYPIILRHMVYEKKFHNSVMKKFLIHVSNHPIKTRDDSLAVQTEYLVYQMRNEHPHLDKKRYNDYRDVVLKELRENDKKLEACIKEATEEMKKDKEMGQQDRRERLREFLLKRIKDASPPPSTV